MKFAYQTVHEILSLIYTEFTYIDQALEKLIYAFRWRFKVKFNLFKQYIFIHQFSLLKMNAQEFEIYSKILLGQFRRGELTTTIQKVRF